MARKSRKHVPLQTSQGGSSLGDLFRAQGLAPASSSETPSEPEPIISEDPTEVSDVTQVVLKTEKKGRRGKTVTRVDGLSPAHLETTRRDLARHLGTGCSVDQSSLIVQGDQRKRLQSWFSIKDINVIIR